MPPWADLVGHRQVRRRQGDERGEYFVHVKGGSRVESGKGAGGQRRKGGTPKGARKGFDGDETRHNKWMSAKMSRLLKSTVI